MITVDDFNRLELQEKLQIAFYEALYLSFVSINRTNFTLYHLQSFYLEHTYDHSTGDRSVTAFRDGIQLDKYVEGINLTDLLKTG